MPISCECLQSSAFSSHCSRSPRSYFPEYWLSTIALGISFTTCRFVHLNQRSQHSEMADGQPWPSTWYENGKIPCRAIGCFKVFDADVDDKKLSKHWRKYLSLNEKRPPTPTEAEHTILYFIWFQTSCPRPYCKEKCGNPKELFVHETTAHTDLDTSTIEGFVSAVRLGLTPNYHGSPYQPILARMMHRLQSLRARSDPATLLLFQRARFSLPENFNDKHFLEATVPLQFQLLYKAPYYHPIHPDDFLQHLKPKPGQSSTEWEEAWRFLRRAYAKGSIRAAMLKILWREK